MQSNTVAAVFIIPEGTYRSVLLYTGDAITIAGKVYIPVTQGKQRFMLPVVVACSERPALLGRDWLQKIKLNWKNIFSVMSGATSNNHSLMYSKVTDPPFRDIPLP